MPLTSPSGRKRSAGACWELNSFCKSDINVRSSASLLTIEPRKKSDQLIKRIKDMENIINWYWKTLKVWPCHLAESKAPVSCEEKLKLAKIYL